SPSTRRSSSSSRTATRSCARCSSPSRRSILPSSSRSCTTTAPRSRRASSSRRSPDASAPTTSSRSPRKGSRHEPERRAVPSRARPPRGVGRVFHARGANMTYLAKPKLHHPTLKANKLGFTRRDYEGKISTLCAGCGHDSISAALVQACWELDIEPHRVAKLSGIGCSSKTPDYFLGASHGFNTVHGRMPSVLTGANLANRDLLYLGVSGDGDSASIGLGQF